ncbi:MAG: hypothetical protein WBM86_14855 [Waterburya sp.]
MKRILVIIAIALGILMFTAPAAWARGGMQGDLASCRGVDCYECCHQRGGCRGVDCYGYRRDGCRGVDCAGVSRFSPVTLETVSGEVIDVYRATSRQDYKSGLHLLLKANEETIDVHLGPISYIEGQNFNFKPGDALEIKGDRFTDSPMPTMIAIEVKKDNDTLTLRDEGGFPMWRASLSPLFSQIKLKA